MSQTDAQSDKKPRHDSMTLHFDKASYQPGDQVCATVIFDLSLIYNDVRLLVELSGVERIRSLTGSQPPHIEFLSLKKLLAPFKQSQMKEGLYKLPLVFVLPLDLPGSTELTVVASMGEHYIAEVNYKVKVSMVDSKGNILLTTFGRITLSDPGSGLQEEECCTRQINSDVFAYGCLNRGKIAAKVTTDRKAWLGNDEVKLNVELDNSESSLDVKSLDFVLWRYTTILAGDSLENEKVKLLSMSIGEFAAGEYRVGEHSFDLKIPLPAARQPLTGSCKSQRISNEYWIDIGLKMSGFQLKKQLSSICLPLTLLQTPEKASFRDLLDESSAILLGKLIIDWEEAKLPEAKPSDISAEALKSPEYLDSEYQGLHDRL